MTHKQTIPEQELTSKGDDAGRLDDRRDSEVVDGQTPDIGRTFIDRLTEAAPHVFPPDERPHGSVLGVAAAMKVRTQSERDWAIALARTMDRWAKRQDGETIRDGIKARTVWVRAVWRHLRKGHKPQEDKVSGRTKRARRVNHCEAKGTVK
ncbi:MAG: hypothetical protein JXQ73_02465 [Phycisphaerae bacterium]|nr:hypothetical protein [Phycisphaerae bacterium]